MSVESSLVTYLKAHAGLAALVGTRIYAGALKDGETADSIVFDLAELPIERLGATPALMDAAVTLLGFSASFDGARAIAAQWYAALQHFTGVLGAGGVNVIACLVDSRCSISRETVAVGTTSDRYVWVAEQQFKLTYEL